MSEDIERLNYYQLQFLGAEDFKAEQGYHRDMRRRHNLGPHTWGIVTGLELATIGNDLYLQPGLAIDGFGREIVVGTPHKLGASDFQFVKPNATVIHSVHIGYAEEHAAPPAFGYGSCDSDAENNRVRELFRIVIDAEAPTHGAIRIDGRDVKDADLPPDLSVPYQELPDVAAARWLVSLGTVTWNGTAAVKSSEKGRVYAGVVAEEVIAPAGALRLKARAPAKITGDEFAVVEGPLRVQGTLHEEKDAILEGGKLSFQPAGDVDTGVPLWMQRIAGPAGEYDLRIRIGADQRGNLTVDTGAGSDPVSTKVLFAVRGTDRVDIPTGTLHFRDVNAIGAQENALYFRSDHDFYWFRRGAHADPRGDPGGGIVAMSLGDLTGANTLSVKGDIAVDGGKLLLRDKNGGEGSDELALTRFQHVSGSTPILNAYDLRVIIGDDIDGVDAFTIGPVYSGQYKEQFKVTNKGDVTAAGSLSLNGPLAANGGLSVTGSTQLQILAVSGAASLANNLTVGGDIHMANGKAMLYGAERFPLDAVAGIKTFTPSIGIGTHQRPIVVPTRLQSVSKAFLHVALAGIHNESNAVDARWSVAYDPTDPMKTTHVGNQYTFTIDLVVDDVDGYIDAVSYVAFFIP